MLPARIAAILTVTVFALGCDALVRASRDEALADVHRMPALDDTSLTLAWTGTPGYSGKTANPLAFRRLLVRGEFARLDSLLTAAADSARRDVGNESYLFNAYDAMMGDSSLAAPLARWSHEDPTSAPARLARAAWLTGQAWNARGTASARNTSRQAMQRMNDLFAEAKKCVDTALTLTPRSAEAYILLISITKPSVDTALSRSYLMKGLEDIPASFILRRQHLRNLIPRWGGSYEAMRAFVDESQAMAETNPRIRHLGGFISLDSAEVFELEKRPQDALAAFDRALSYGDEPYFHLERGEMLVRAGRARDALPDLDAAVAGAPGTKVDYLWRGYAREILSSATDENRRDLRVSALTDYQHAVLLDSTDDYAVFRFEHLYRLLH